ncbi:hypothetical protein [Nocardioides sp. LML1-1-1.1]|uniref:hypothetical protein n=1 Tax=Nocardioides sp. LML1-1-1.1 TaxID=3135248 RepID=UPI0034460C67
MSTTKVHGLPACSCLAAWIPVFERRIGRTLRWFQLIGDAKASAGFHRGGGSGDSEPLSNDELRIARNMGGAAWNRWWENNHHCHIRLNGCPHNTLAQPQVNDLNERRDGTGPLYDNAGVPDNGPRDGVHWPLRTWRQGIDWATKQEDDMPYTEKQLTDIIRAAVQAELKATGLADLPRLEQTRFQNFRTKVNAIAAKLGVKL